MVTKSDNNSLAARRHMMTLVMQETIASLCRNMLTFEAELCVEGLLGITLDKTDVILLNIKQVIPIAGMPTILSDEANDSVSRGAAGCEDQDHDPSAEISLFGELQSNNGFDNERATENGCPPLNRNVKSIRKKLGVTEADDSLGSERPEGDRMEGGVEARELESRRVNDPKSSQTEDCDVLETESCSELLTRTRKWKEKLDHLNVECTTQPWNNVQIKQEHLDDLAETACELSGFAAQDADSFDLSYQARSFQQCHGERSASGQVRWLNFSSSDPSGFNNSDVDPLNSSCGVGTAGDRINQCTMCVMTFTTKHHLKRHINAIHSRSPLLFHCPICRKAFRRRDTMKRHCKSVHYKELGFGALDVMQFASIEAD